MTKVNIKKNQPSPKTDNDVNSNFEGYPLYPDSEDIYNKSKEETEIDPANISRRKTSTVYESIESRNEKDFSDDFSGDDLDIPGGELDDAQEAIGNEDEENNYYSLGGDNHNDLEEDQGD